MLLLIVSIMLNEAGPKEAWRHEWGTLTDLKSTECFEVVPCICIYVYVVYIYFLFLSPSPPSQAADFDMCSIVWSWICHLCLHLLCGLLFEVSLVASSSWLYHHPICHLDGAHCSKHCSPVSQLCSSLHCWGVRYFFRKQGCDAHKSFSSDFII